MQYETAGDPISGLKWTKKSPEKIAQFIESQSNYKICGNTVCTLLKEMGYSLKINHKKIEYNKILTQEEKLERDLQFKYIETEQKIYRKKQDAIISIDAKKKELIGNFKNQGSNWLKEHYTVNAYDYPTWAIGIGIPYGIYNLLKNTGTVIVGTSHNTSDFAINSLKKWWETEGEKYYGKSRKILILADGGGSNASRSRVWKYGLQHELCNKYEIEITVAHYPPGTSKYNPIEHRLFSQISNNWAGRPLINYQTMLNFIATTSTSTGLTVNALIDNNLYEIGKKISDKEMNELHISYHQVLPKWNYTISPY